MAIAIGLAAAAGAIVGLLAGGGDKGSDSVNTVSIQVTDAVMAEVDQEFDANINYVLRNITINIVGGGTVNIDQTTEIKSMVNIKSAVNVLAKLAGQLSQKASLKDRSFLGIDFSKQKSGSDTQEQFRNTISQTLKETTSINVTKVIDNVTINVNPATNTGIISSPQPLVINLKQGGVIDVRNEVEQSVKNSLQNQINVDQKAKSDTSSDPISNFFNGLAHLFGSMQIFWLLLIGGVLLYFLMGRGNNNNKGKTVIRERIVQPGGYGYGMPPTGFRQPMYQQPPMQQQFTQAPVGYQYVPTQPTTQQVPVRVPPGFTLQPVAQQASAPLVQQASAPEQQIAAK